MSGDIDAIDRINDVEKFQCNCENFRRDGMFCDAFINIPGETPIPVHRVILAACSSYFRSLFTWDSEKSLTHDVKICGVSRKTMEIVVEYAYHGKVIVNAYNVEDLFAAADRFHVFGLLKECEAFLLNELSSENCIGMMQYFKSYNCEHGFKKSRIFIKQNFEEVAQVSQEFLQLDVNHLKNIICDDEILVSNESEVFAAVKRWVCYNSNERLQYYSELFCLLRLVFIEEEYFKKFILNNGILLCDSNSKNAIKKVHDMTGLIRESGSSFIDLRDNMLRPRVPSEVLFAVGGWSKKGVVDTFETFDRNVNSWFRGSSTMPQPRSYHATVPMNTCLYIIGGFDGRKYLSDVKCFHTETQVWENKSSMKTDRCYVAAALVNGDIYACGGFDGRIRHDTAERYQPQTNQWTAIEPMHVHRSDAGAASYEDKLFIAGGFDGQTCLNSLEMYNPQTGQWTLLERMNTSRSGVSMVSFQNSLYAIGGYDGNVRLPTVELYNPRRNSWLTAADLKLGRSNFSAVVFGNKIYAIGGYDGSKTSNNVEYYNPTTRTWKKTYDLIVGRSAVSACVLKKLPNARDFTFFGYFDNVEGSIDE